MGCVLPTKPKKILMAVPSLKTSLLDKKNRPPNDSSQHGEVHFDDSSIQRSASKEMVNSTTANHDLKETLKRTNTPNFRKNFNYEPKFGEEDSNRLEHDETDNQQGSHKKVLMKSPTFSKNITNPKKSQLKPLTLVENTEQKETSSTGLKDGLKKEQEKPSNDIENALKMERPESPNATRKRLAQSGKHSKEHSPSPQNLNNIPLKTVSSINSNMETKSPSNYKLESVASNPKLDKKLSSSQKLEGKSPSNQQSNESHRSLDKICEEESNMQSPDKKSLRGPSYGRKTGGLNGENQNNNLNVNMFKTNLIDFFRNEEKTSSNNVINPNPVLPKNSKKNLILTNKVSQQSINLNTEILSPTYPNSKPLFEQQDFPPLKEKGLNSKFFHINPNANLISMFKNETEQQNLNLGEDDNHNFVTIDDDGPSPINRPPLQSEIEPDRETSLNISTFENVCSNEMTNSNIEKSEVNRTTINNVEEISKDLSKYSINADYLNVEYDDKKGNRDHSPSNNANILSGLNSPINANHQPQSQATNPAIAPHQKTLGLSAMKTSNKQPGHKQVPQEENKFLSPTISKKPRPAQPQDKFKLRSLTMKEMDDSGGEGGEEKQSPNHHEENNISTNNNNNMVSSISPSLFKKQENNRLDVSMNNKAPMKSPRSMVPLGSGKLQRAKTTLEAENSVVHTSKLDITKDEQGNKKINQYMMIKDLGKGGFGKVKLAVNENDKKNYAIKIANKKKLKRKLLSRNTSAFTLLEKEVATMKKLNHPNIVRLYEVIDDADTDKLYLVMEFMKKGAILSKSYFKYEEKTLQEDLNFDAYIQKNELQDKKTLTYEKAQKYFRDFLLGLDYLHTYANVIHRDIKPENLLVDENDVLKLADFGVSTIMENGNDQLATNAGTKAFLAPETWDGKPFKGKKADVWAAAATLYFLVVGKLPFHATNAEDLKKKITEDQPDFPSDMPVSLQELILKGLEKNPEKRITVPMMMNHPWVTDNGINPLENFLEEEVFELSEKDLRNAMTKLSFRATIMLTCRLKQSLNRTRSRILQRKASNASNYSQISEIN